MPTVRERYFGAGESDFWSRYGASKVISSQISSKELARFDKHLKHQCIFHRERQKQLTKVILNYVEGVYAIDLFTNIEHSLSSTNELSQHFCHVIPYQ